MSADYIAVPCCDYRDHASGECLCDEHDASDLHPFGRYWFGTHNDGSDDA